MPTVHIVCNADLYITVCFRVTFKNLDFDKRHEEVQLSLVRWVRGRCLSTILH